MSLNLDPAVSDVTLPFGGALLTAPDASTPPPWSATVSVRSDRTTLTVAGEFDLACAARLDHALRRLDHSPGTVEIDLRAVSFADSHGMKPILRAARRRGEAGVPALRLARVGPEVSWVLQLLGLAPGERPDTALKRMLSRSYVLEWTVPIGPRPRFVSPASYRLTARRASVADAVEKEPDATVLVPRRTDARTRSRRYPKPLLSLPRVVSSTGAWRRAMPAWKPWGVSEHADE